MRLRLILLAILLLAAAVGGGYLLGAFLQAPDDILAAFSFEANTVQAAPLPIAPASGSEFVQSDLELAWSWKPALAEDQFFALRIRAEDRPWTELWTVDSAVQVSQIIDSFSVDYGKYYWQVAVVNVDAEGAYKSPGSEWSELAVLQRLRRERASATSYSDMSATAKLFHNLDLSATELIDAVHLFINQNSLTNEQLDYAPDFSDAVDIMYDHAQGLTAEMPQIQCDGRSTAMLTILQQLGIESRLVFLYMSSPGWLSQHTVLEVFNPDTQYWQVHDVGFDFYYMDADTGQRVSAARILFGAHDELAGCPIEGGDCNATVMRPGIGYFGAMRYGFTFDMWVNPDRFNLSARFEGQGNQNLAEFVGDGQAERVAFRLDNWHGPDP